MTARHFLSIERVRVTNGQGCPSTPRARPAHQRRGPTEVTAYEVAPLHSDTGDQVYELATDLVAIQLS